MAVPLGVFVSPRENWENGVSFSNPVGKRSRVFFPAYPTSVRHPSTNTARYRSVPLENTWFTPTGHLSSGWPTRPGTGP